MSRKYINKFETTAAALAAEDLYAPQVAYVGDVDKTFFSGVIQNNKKVAFEGSGDTLALNPVIDYFTVEVVQATNKILTIDGSFSDWNLEYSKNGGEWTAWTADITGLNTGDKIRLRGTGNVPTSSKHIAFRGGGTIHVLHQGNQVKVYGHVMSLYDYTGDFSVVPDYACSGMFFDYCDGLISAENLFSGVTTVGTRACYAMFKDCTSLTTAPELPATTLANLCYYHAFENCSSLTTAPSVLPATILASECYRGMFQGSASLTVAPELCATTLATDCCGLMFYNCTSLNYVKHHITNWNTSPMSSWLLNVASAGTVECPTASTIPSNDASGIPTGWTRVNF